LRQQRKKTKRAAGTRHNPQARAALRPYPGFLGIPRTACETFQERSFATWGSIWVGWATGIDPSEGTLTDNNLLEIQLSHPIEIRTRKYSPYEEGRRSGADWEWWFGAPSGWVGV